MSLLSEAYAKKAILGLEIVYSISSQVSKATVFIGETIITTRGEAESCKWPSLESCLSHLS